MRCHRFYTVVGRRHNVEVLVPVSDFGYATRMYQCRRCREFYAADDEFLGRLHVPDGAIPVDVLGEERCRSCESLLVETLVRYPDPFVTPEGETGTFSSPPALPTGDEAIWQDAWFIDN